MQKSIHSFYSAATITTMRTMRTEGRLVHEIALATGASCQTICKYTKGIIRPKLIKSQARVWFLWKEKGMTPKQIAALTGKTANCVRSTLSQIRRSTRPFPPATNV